MRKAIPLLPLSLLWLAGCILTPPVAPVAQSPPPPRSTPLAPPPVRAEQVTPDNAQKMSQALADELDREAQRDMIPSAQPR
jgi:hypothetical protein